VPPRLLWLPLRLPPLLLPPLLLLLLADAWPPIVLAAPSRSQQMSIRSFFKPAAAARDPPPAGEDEQLLLRCAEQIAADTPAAKRARTGDADGLLLSPAGNRSKHETPAKVPVEDAGPASSLTPEQLERIAKNKALALERKREMETEAKKATGDVLPAGGATSTVMDAALAMPAKWKEKLKGEFDKPYFKKLVTYHAAQIAAKKTIFPPTAQVFSAFYACDFDKISVVIVGQDPYHGPKQAHGLCFSVQKGVAIPPSLRNMYQELSQDPAIPFKTPNHGCLTKWAEQGVLMLNACLSVESGKANSHQGQGWEQFTDAVIAACNKSPNSLVFLLWGAPAAKKCASVDMKRHTVLKAPHPSPLSAYRGFFGCRHFSKCNEQLKKAGRKEIDWQID